MHPGSLAVFYPYAFGYIAAVSFWHAEYKILLVQSTKVHLSKVVLEKEFLSFLTHIPRLQAGH